MGLLQFNMKNCAILFDVQPEVLVAVKEIDNISQFVLPNNLMPTEFLVTSAHENLRLEMRTRRYFLANKSKSAFIFCEIEAGK